MLQGELRLSCLIVKRKCCCLRSRDLSNYLSLALPLLGANLNLVTVQRLSRGISATPSPRLEIHINTTFPNTSKRGRGSSSREYIQGAPEISVLGRNRTRLESTPTFPRPSAMASAKGFHPFHGQMSKRFGKNVCAISLLDFCAHATQAAGIHDSSTHFYFSRQHDYVSTTSSYSVYQAADQISTAAIES